MHHTFQKQTILTDKELLGQGKRRQCYQHPEKRDHCVKIPFPDRKSLRLQKREERYFHYLHARNLDLSHIANYRGTISTNRGKGALYDLIRDYDGSVSHELSYHLKNQRENQATLEKLVDSLGAYLLRHRILFYDLNGSNVFLQKLSSSENQLIVIDGLGDASGLAFINRIPTFARRAGIRRWNRFLNRLKKFNPTVKDFNFHYY